jgi:hypothetical protein
MLSSSQSANERNIEGHSGSKEVTMTNNFERFGSRAVAALLTVVFSVAMVASAIGPAVADNAAQTTAANFSLGEPSPALG